MLKAYKYRLYPTESQKILLEKHFGCCRFIFNLALEVKQAAYISARKNLSAFDLMKQIPDLKKDCDWLKEVNAQSLQNSLVNMEKAFTRFFRGDAKFPKFKNKHSRQSFSCPQVVRMDFQQNKIFLPKFREGIKAVFDKRNLKGQIKTATITRTPTNKYFASVLVFNDVKPPKKGRVSESSSIGIDLGIKSFIVTSDGQKFDNPKFLHAALSQIKKLQRKKDKKIKGSSNRKKATLRLSILHEKITNKRKDFLHKLSSKIIRENQTICIEDIGTAKLMAKNSLAQAIGDVAWGEFVRMLKYKSEWHGKNILQIGKFEPSSRICSSCGVRNETLSLKDREWTCANCGKHHDRDINAAINVKSFALRDQRKSRRGTPAVPVEPLRIRMAKKQEYESNSE